MDDDKMYESKRFVQDLYPLLSYDNYCVLDKVQHKHLCLAEVVKLLNELSEENERLKSKGLQILDFYESQLLDAFGTEDYQTAIDKWSLIKFVLCEMGVINK